MFYKWHKKTWTFYFIYVLEVLGITIAIIYE